MRSKWRANGGPQIKAKTRNGEKRRQKRKDDAAGAGGNENEYDTNQRWREGWREGACAVRCGQHSALTPWL